ncbi:MAG TPA: hypothetical protein VMK53_05090 [Gemmatimonadales bacterium]|nr:hypothetical protein [Gemmatimonadales bacterium]
MNEHRSNEAANTIDQRLAAMQPRRPRRRLNPTLVLGAALIFGGCADMDRNGQERDGDGDFAAVAVSSPDRESASALIAGWPAQQREAATLMIEKYGQPTVQGDQMLAWFGNGPYVKTVIMRDEVQHNFPMEHVDFLTQTVKLNVPANRLAALYEYDGSVWYHRTRGELSAQCDVEEMNLLALNLAHDVITGKRTPADARDFFAKTAMAFKQGDRSSPYVTGLMFTQDGSAADPGTAHGM